MKMIGNTEVWKGFTEPLYSIYRDICRKNRKGLSCIVKNGLDDIDRNNNSSFFLLSFDLNGISEGGFTLMP